MRLQNFDDVIVASMQLHPHFEQVNDPFNMHLDKIKLYAFTCHYNIFRQV